MKFNYYIDESGTEDWATENYFTITTCCINEKCKPKINQNFDYFKKNYSKRLEREIQYLHGNEITFGLNQGKGIYAKLKTDSKLKEKFFLDLNKLLDTSEYQIFAFSLSLQDYLEVFYQRLDEYYSNRKERFEVNQIFNSFIYPSCLLQSIEQIRKHINTQKPKIKSIDIFIEEKNSNIEIANTYANKRLSDVLNRFTPNIKKTGDQYEAGFEIADLSANAINRSITSRKRKDYEVIKGKIMEHKRIDKNNMDKYIPKIQKSS